MCGVFVAVVLADMDRGDNEMNAKRLKGMDGKRHVPENHKIYKNHSISPFRIFMESFTRGCDMKDFLEIDRKGFEKWKIMSEEEKRTYICQANILDYIQQEALDEEAWKIRKVRDDGANSAMVGKFDKSYLNHIESSSDLVDDDEDCTKSSSVLPREFCTKSSSSLHIESYTHSEEP